MRKNEANCNSSRDSNNSRDSDEEDKDEDGVGGCDVNDGKSDERWAIFSLFCCFACKLFSPPIPFVHAVNVIVAWCKSFHYLLHDIETISPFVVHVLLDRVKSQKERNIKLLWA